MISFFNFLFLGGRDVSSSRGKRSVRVRTLEKIRPGAKPLNYSDLLVIGWREWIGLPGLGIKNIKAKIDTGARTSALHAFEIKPFLQDGREYVSFKVHPFQKNRKHQTECTAEVVDKRLVKNSGGKSSHRIVIATRIKVGELSWRIELNLINRDEMGFRMLLGREALRGHLLVNPGKSYLLGRRVKDESGES